jgi:hypothetical protein
VFIKHKLTIKVTHGNSYDFEPAIWYLWGRQSHKFCRFE